MRAYPTPLVLLCLLLSAPLCAQTLLPVNIQQRCVFSGGLMDEELYRFDDNGKVAEWVQEILDLGGAERNFQLVQTNVENVSAVLDGRTRYLFYSLDFIQKASRVEVYGALAHEIGHHANQHTFAEGRRVIEESEADFFMGYFFSKKNIPKGEITDFLRKMPSSYGIGVSERLKAVLDGYDKANDALALKSKAFDHDPKLQDVLLPTFTFRPCYTTCDLPRTKFAGVKTLGKVDEKIRLMLDQQGYSNRSYFSVKNGFAVVTQMEQYNSKDATIRNDRTRWLEYPARDNFNGIMDYLVSIAVPNKGHFRVFVFVVQNEVFRASGDKVGKSEAAAWLGQGANRLPPAIANLAFTNDYVVSALVYEFEVPQSNWKAKQVCPTPTFDARTHLVKAGMD